LFFTDINVRQTPSQATETPISFVVNFKLDFKKIFIPFGLLMIFFISPELKIMPLNILIIYYYFVLIEFIS
jgi:hypothetical protein